MVEMARSNRKRPLHILWDDWSRCWPSTSQDLYSSKICILIFIWQIFSPASVIFTGVGILLSVRIPLNIRAYPIVTAYFYQAAKDVRASQNTVLDIFERIEMFFGRLEVYTEVEPTPEMMDIMVLITVEVLSILGIATKEIKQGRTSE
jgi:hypothetical protein